MLCTVEPTMCAIDQSALAAKLCTKERAKMCTGINNLQWAPQHSSQACLQVRAWRACSGSPQACLHTYSCACLRARTCPQVCAHSHRAPASTCVRSAQCGSLWMPVGKHARSTPREHLELIAPRACLDMHRGMPLHSSSNTCSECSSRFSSDDEQTQRAFLLHFLLIGHDMHHLLNTDFEVRSLHARSNAAVETRAQCAP